MMCWDDYYPADFANCGPNYLIIVSTGKPMLIIRKAQMDALGAYMLSQNLPRIVEDFEVMRRPYFLRMGAEESHKFVLAAVKTGLNWGIRKFADMWALIDLMLEFGLEFAADPGRPWAAPILDSPTLSGTAKIKLISAYLKRQLD
jgi:hypothetical protein